MIRRTKIKKLLLVIAEIPYQNEDKADIGIDRYRMLGRIVAGGDDDNYYFKGSAYTDEGFSVGDIRMTKDEYEKYVKSQVEIS